MKCFAAISLIALFFGRPTHGQHEDAIAGRVAQVFNIEQGRLFEAGKSFAGNEYLEITDCYLFTIGTVRGQVVSIGALRMVYVRDKILTLKLLMS